MSARPDFILDGLGAGGAVLVDARRRQEENRPMRWHVFVLALVMLMGSGSLSSQSTMPRP